MGRKLCGFIDFRTGSLIVGWVDLITTIIIFLLSLGSYLCALTYEDSDDLHEEYYAKCLLKIAPPTMIFCLIGIVLCFMFLYGIYKNKKNFLKPWLVVYGLSIILIVFIVLLLGHSFGLDDINLIDVVYYAVGVSMSGIRTYFWIFIMDYYQEMKRQEEANRATDDEIPIMKEQYLINVDPMC